MLLRQEETYRHGHYHQGGHQSRPIREFKESLAK